MVKPIEEISIEELKLLVAQIAKLTDEVKGLINLCESKNHAKVWLFTVFSLRQSVAKLRVFCREIDPAIVGIVRGNPLGPEATKKRPSAKEKTDAAVDKLSKARRRTTARPD